MNKISGSNFPDANYLNNLVERFKEWFAVSQKPLDQLITYSGVAMNSIGDYISDENVSWKEEALPVDDLWLTGTNPEWNAIVMKRCEQSPQKLRALFEAKPAVAHLFDRAQYDDRPILVRYEDDKYKVLDGMHRTIAAIRDGKTELKAFVATLAGVPQPKCEAHVIYDLLRPYARKINTNREQLIGALRFLRHSYVNVDNLLKNRFSKEWLPDDEIQKIIQEALID